MKTHFISAGHTFLPTFLFITVLISLGWSTHSLSLELRGPYDVEISIDWETTSQTSRGTPAAHQELIQKAFKTMLVRATGQEKVLNSPIVMKALSRVDDYVKQFAFHQNKEQERTFRVQFHELMVSDLIHQGNFKVLSQRSRPPVLMWALLSHQNQHTWLSEAQALAPGAQEEFQRISQRLGISLVTPMLDISETNQGLDQSILSQQFDPVIQASSRYNTACILIGKISKQPSGWYAEWTLLRPGQNHTDTWDISHSDLNILASESLETLVHRMSHFEDPEEDDLDRNFHMT